MPCLQRGPFRRQTPWPLLPVAVASVVGLIAQVPAWADEEDPYQTVVSANEAFEKGKFEEALAVLDDGIAADRMDRMEGSRRNMIKYGYKAEIYAEKGDFDSALEAYETVLELHPKHFTGSKGTERDYYVQLLAQNNELQKAEEVANAMRKDIDEKSEWQMSAYWYAVGCIAFARGDYEASRVSFKKN